LKYDFELISTHEGYVAEGGLALHFQHNFPHLQLSIDAFVQFAYVCGRGLRWCGSAERKPLSTLLKMDVEGGEWEVLESMTDADHDKVRCCVQIQPCSLFFLSFSSSFLFVCLR
jgi:hypothetical protein